MKMFLCTQCLDVRRLRRTRTYCQCRKAWARYTDDKEHEAQANHYALIIGLDTGTLRNALRRKIDAPKHVQIIETFLLPEPCKTVARVGRLAI